ncbi:MAG TPA: carboxymuconolactone decarboxylase family protein [Candidatus Baltobacteraceae bacterium]|nr:carboxymuconolactone decarboxylase family protein [Candidatus Baltobacteraceae bacterium]
MTQRLDYQTAAPHILRPLFEAGKALSESSLEPALQTCVLIRASQINGCAFCLALHVREAQALGESGDRVNGLAAWRDAPWYSERERAALECTETLTRISAHHPDDALYERVKKHFSDREMAELSFVIASITTWNMLNVGFRTDPTRAEEVFERLHPNAAAATN